MAKIKQEEIAKFIGMSTSTVSEIRRENKEFSKKKAKELSDKTGIPFETLALGTGETLYQHLVFAYQNKPNKKQPLKDINGRNNK